MKLEEQDKLWAQLSEESKEQMRERYKKPIEDSDPNAEYFRGIRYQTGLMFGKHNLKSAQTYEGVAKELFKNGAWQPGDYDHLEFDNNPNPLYDFNCTTKKQFQKLVAINKLLNVAKFLNKNEDGSYWVPDWNNKHELKWCILIDYEEDEDAEINFIFSEYENASPVYFRTEALARQAIQILGEDVVRTALTTVY